MLKDFSQRAKCATLCYCLVQYPTDVHANNSFCFYSKGKGNTQLIAKGCQNCTSLTMDTFLPGWIYLSNPAFMLPFQEETHKLGFLVGPVYQTYGYDQAHLNSNGECWACSDTFVPYYNVILPFFFFLTKETIILLLWFLDF